MSTGPALAVSSCSVSAGGAVRVGLLTVSLLFVAVAACGGEGDDTVPTIPSVPTTSSPPSGSPTTDTSLASTTTTPSDGSSCASVLSRALRLFENWRNDQRGIAGPQNEAQHRADARALAAEGRRRGCPVPAGIEQIIDG